MSIRARLFLSILRNRHLLQFKRRPETGADWKHDLAAVRVNAKRSAKMLGRIPKGMESEALSIETMQAEWIRPEHHVGDMAMLYFHGGGYVLGDVEQHRGITAKFAKASGVQALLFGYRLAPEHPHPAALEDALRAYEWMLGQGYAPERIAFMGDSAGGGLLLATLLSLRDKGKRLPATAVALSPWVDLTCSGDSYTTNAHRCLSPPLSWLACRKHYAKGQNLAHPYISPLHGDLSGLSPLLIYAGEHEALRDDSTAFAAKIQAAGGEVSLHVGKGMCHCYPACAPLFPEASEALDHIGKFIREKLGH